MARLINFLVAIAFAMAAPAQALVHGEYYFDVDPGFGNGTPINFPQAAEVSLPLSLDVSALAPGVHVLGTRMRDDAGSWGLTNRRFFMVRSMASGGDIVRMEYFLDADPGFGMATSVATTAAPEVTGLLLSVLTDALAAGPHSLSVRSRSSTGAWSLTNSVLFNVFVGIDELESLGITAGPNPMREELVLRRASGGTAIDIDLLDAQGRRLRGERWTNDRLDLDTSDLAAGCYLLLVRMAGMRPLVLKVAKA
ncbi:MAG TPA: T9SS type A sorting domain-containing protein [Flavobacteriales bacterium]|nr:T9SS type A sorting domain-containing protein [Flavobacteriales bacterium]